MGWRRKPKPLLVERPASEMTVSEYHAWYWGGPVLVDRDGIAPIPVVPGDTVAVTCRGRGRAERVVITIVEDPGSGQVRESEREALNA